MNRWIEFDENGYVITKEEWHYSDTCIRNEWDAEIGDQLKFDENGKVIGKLSPNYSKLFNTGELWGLFTPTEFRSLYNLAKTDDKAFQFLEIANVSGIVDVSTPRFINGIGIYLVNKNVLSQTRANEILLGLPV